MTKAGRILEGIVAPSRRDADELIDSPDVTSADFEQSFRDIRRINRFLGGVSIIRRELDRQIKPSESASLLDLGTGTADIPLAMIKRFRAHSGNLSATGLDANQKIIEIARLQTSAETRLKLLVGNAASLPFADGAFDFVTCSLTLHHFSDALSITALREMVRVSRRAVIVNDLKRGYLPAALIWIVTRLALMHRLTKHDGPLSVMRSRTVPEYRELGSKAGFPGAQIRSYPFWRVALVLVKDGR
jgi:ubiquinone/menaquinone biosynthesis C-methylase UbiE